MTTSHEWNLLLIGGSSATGKSTLAKVLARNFDSGYLDTDLIWMTLLRALPEAALLQTFQREPVWSRPTSALVRDNMEISRFVCETLEHVLAHLHRTRQRYVLDGTWLLPEFAVQRTYGGREVDDVEALFVFEDDPREIARRLEARPGGVSKELTPQIKKAQVALQHAYGLEIKRQAEAHRLPVIPSRPLNTLTERAMSALELRTA